MKRKITTLVAMLLSFIVAHAQPTVLTSNFSHPESILRDGNFLYVTEVGKALAAKEKDGDGALYKLDLQGKPVDLSFNKTALNAPKGIAVIGDNLYVNDIDRIVVIDKNSGQKKDEIDLSSLGTLFLNDVAVKDQSTLFVSATDIGKIFMINLTKPYKATALGIPMLTGPNGLAYDSKKNVLYVGGLTWADTAEGEVGKITWSGSVPTYQKIADVAGYFDGLQLIDNNTLIASDWTSLKNMQSRLIKFNLKAGTYDVICTGVDAADIFYDVKEKRLLLPGLKGGTVSFLTMK
jgi:hypothetical protein